MASQNKKVELALRRARADGVLLLSNCGLSALPPVAFDLIAGWSGGDEPPSLECFTSQELTKIDVSHNELGALPAEMATFELLQTLRAQHCALCGPLALKKCSALQILDLRHNALGSVDLDTLFALRELDLSHNDLRQIGSLPPNLDQLRASHNRLATLPALPECLSSIAVEHNELRELPPLPSTLANCEVAHNKLASIDLSPCAALALLDARENALRAVPTLPSQTVSKQPAKLARLRLSFNKLEALALPPLPALVELHAQSAGLRKLDDSGLAPLLALRVLDVSNNELGELPAVLGYLPKLDRVIADGNPLRSIKRTLWQSGQGYLGTHALKKYLRTRGPPPAGSGYLDEENDGGGGGGDAPATLDASGVRAAAREAASGGRVLDVSGRGLGALPLEQLLEQLCDLPAPTEDFDSSTALQRVTALRVGGNRLATLGSGGGASILLSQMRGLRVVDGTRNKLQQLPAALAALAVEEIHVAYNSLSVAAVETLIRPPAAGGGGGGVLFSALRHVDLSANSLDAIPPSLCALPKVDTIKLSHNRLTSLYASGGGWVCATPSLAHLDLSSNQLVDLGELPLQLSPERMRTLSLENNALTAVPAALSRLSALGTLGLAGNPQRQVRQGLLEKGTLAIMEYLRTMAPPTATAASDDGAAAGAGGGAAAAARSEVDELGARLDAVTAELQAPGLSEAKKYALKKDAAKVKAEKIRAERRLKENLQTLLRTQSSWIDPKSGELLTRL